MNRPIHLRPPRQALPILLIMSLIAAWGCSSSKTSTIDPFGMADEARSPADLLDEPSASAQSSRTSGGRRASQRRSSSASERPQFSVPQAAAQPARQIDATPQGWNLSSIRRFDQRQNVIEGAGAWSGQTDASFSAAVDVDDSHIYFWIEVKDDQIISSHPSRPQEGVLIWIGDPGFDQLLRSLPEDFSQRLATQTHPAIFITPDGQIGRYGQAPAPAQNSVHIATAYTDSGYIVEAAFSLEALSFITQLPLKQIAFRIEVLDTDDPQSPSYQKRLSMFPPRDDGQPRFALLELEGLLPLLAPAEGPPRTDALGLWRQTRDGWRFETLEYVSPHWRVIEDLQGAAAQVVDRGPLPTICTGPDQAMWLVEAYEATSRAQRVALVLCGTDNQAGACPKNARTQLVWTSMKDLGDDAWIIDHVQELFPDDLEQCPFQGRTSQPYYHSFSMLPLGLIGPSVWGIGWHMSRKAPQSHLERAGVYFVDPRSKNFIVGDLPLRHIEDNANRRTRHDSRVYLTDLNDDDAMDICEIEIAQDQLCKSLGKQCETVPRGRELLTHIKTWNTTEHRFDDYLLQRHDRCRGSMTITDTAGYKILLVEDRLGLIRAPR